MYSVVLMMAMVGGGDTPAWGCSKCCGGCYGCRGCCGGRKCHGCCGGKKCHGCHGCCGCYGCYGCCGGYYGCCGGCCGGYACCGGFACGGGIICGGCAAVAPVVPVVPDGTKKDGTKKKTSMDSPAPATIVVDLPAEAKLLIDGAATSSTSAQRVFVSPELNPGRDYHYTLTAEFVQNGKTVSVSREIAVQAGNETRVSLAAETATGVASR